MKISQIIQETSTTAGSVAPTEHGFVKMQTRNPSVYGGNKVGNLLKGKKTSKPFANSLNEAAMKDLVYDLQNMKPAEFFKKYGKSREEMKASMSKQPQKSTPPVNETDLSEQDLIVVPGQGRSVKTGFVPHGKSRIDHEVEMARSDLFSAAKNAKKVYSMIKDIGEDEGLDGWVQEKIIKANDYLNTIREYLEGKQVQSVTEGAEIMYAEELAEKLFDRSPNLQNEDDILTRGFQLTKKDPRIGSRVNAIFRDADFPSDFVSYYRYIQHNHGISSGMNEQGATESLGTTGAMTNGEMGEGKRNLKCVCNTHGTLQCPVHTPKDIDVLESANKRSMTDNKNKKK